ncbi:MAG: amylo-alpha-1,6-glucosidase [Bacteroidales bacterium]|jgi:predicted glycogen debranching enzyme|nr:amylo-alpha-1,6-glucosidase [Bacteroidales bacterium]MDI9576102.1 amylo-alpha-1,6-glucosidase [Bacteroidota bacterium]MDY0401053.1 amylo-alpha-1,6-glucosidase [Bacteroidales bacterium]HOB77786.1 amylo-alpha-1,6-glucosidase [Bacteroidales bacterium]HPZ61155.1 amylo-alpha-1,6-glucosidase [Bacteroidales bacterium]
MGYLSFDKQQLVNLEFSLNREIIRANRAGSYASTTIIYCNTRKYHGLLISPQPQLDDDLHVFLSTLDESIIQHGSEFNIGIHRYPGGIYSPKGHKYVEEFHSMPIPTLIYHVGGVILSKQLLFINKEDRVLVKYTLLDAHSETFLRLKPFLAFRNYHTLSKANMYANKNYEECENGIIMKLYQGYSPLYIQISKESKYVHAPDWYYNIEYTKELERGYDGHEDLLVPGYFEFPIKKGESVIISAGLSETKTNSLKRLFTNELKNRIPRDSYENNLINSAQQFIIQRGNEVEIKAGYHWFGRWGRDTLISLPGLTLVTGNYDLCKKAIDTLLADKKGPLLPNVGKKQRVAINSADTSLWLFWTIQQYQLFTNETPMKIWRYFKDDLISILYGYRNGEAKGIWMSDDGLINAKLPGYALTWMDAIVDGKPVTPRYGKAVEINALWYNAICYTIYLAEHVNDEEFINDWLPIKEKVELSFVNNFWDEERGYLADFVDNDEIDWCVRPNMTFATSLPYVCIDEKKRLSILERIQQELLTPRGLRTLSPKCPNYRGLYEGPIRERDLAYHQGTVWPWLLGAFAEGYLRIHGKAGLPFIEKIYYDLEPTLAEHGIGSISEVFDGDPPHKPGGAISQAWSVAEILRIKWLIEKYKNL